MTTPLGDLPDWQTIVNPPILPVSLAQQTGGLNGTLIQSSSPFRVWGLWISALFSSNASYVAALNNVASQIKDGAGNVLLEVDLDIRVANTAQHAELSLAIPGFTPALIGGFYTVTLATGASPVNTDYRASAGLFYSAP